MSGGEGQSPDDLRVSLSWPGEDQTAPEHAELQEPGGTNPEPAEPGAPPSPTDEPQAPAGASFLREETSSGLRRRRPTPAAQALPGLWTSPPDPATAGIGGIQALVAEVAATRARVDTLTDATVTLRSFVNERMADVGQAVTRAQAQTVREINEAISRIPAPDVPDVGQAVERSQAQATREIADAVDRSQAQTIDEVGNIIARTATPDIPDFDEALGRSQAAIAANLETALAKFQSRAARQLDEALIEARAQTAQDIDAAIARSQNQVVAQIDEVTIRWQAQSSRQADQLQRRYDEASTTISECLVANQEAVRRIDQLAAALSAELATVGQRLGDDVALAGEKQRSELTAVSRRMSDEVKSAISVTREDARAGTDRAVTDITSLSETVADALTQVADRLETLALSNSGQEDIVEAVADALDDVAGRVDELDQTGRSRHDRLMAVIGDLRSARNQPPAVDLRPVTNTLAKIEVSVEALAQAADEDHDVADQAAELVERVEGLAAQIKAAPPAPVDRSTVAAMTRIEGRLSELTRQREEHEEATKATLDSVAETVSRLAAAQAEDLERILDTVEHLGSSPSEASVSLSGGDAQRLGRIEAQLRTLTSQPKAADADRGVGEQLASLSAQIEALRRRMAVRGRSPVLDDDTIDALAEAVAARLASTTPPARARSTQKAAGGASRPRMPSP